MRHGMVVYIHDISAQKEKEAKIPLELSSPLADIRHLGLARQGCEVVRLCAVVEGNCRGSSHRRVLLQSMHAASPAAAGN